MCEEVARHLALLYFGLDHTIEFLEEVTSCTVVLVNNDIVFSVHEGAVTEVKTLYSVVFPDRSETWAVERGHICQTV